MRTEVSTPGSGLGLRSWKFDIRAAGAERLAEVLAQCPALTHLYLDKNQIGDAGAERFAGVRPQCPALARFDLGNNTIGTVGQGRLRGSWCGQAVLFCGHLSLLALCHLFSRQATTRKSDILYKYSMVAFGLALWL